MFLTLGGVNGESEDKNHPKQIGVLSGSWDYEPQRLGLRGRRPSVGKSMAGRAKSPNSWWHRRLNFPEGSIAALRVFAER